MPIWDNEERSWASLAKEFGINKASLAWRVNAGWSVEDCLLRRVRKIDLDLIGRRFGRLVVKSKTKKRNKDRRIIFKCLCDCGVYKLSDEKSLKQGHTKSCGCLHAEGNRCTHKMKGTRTYRIWQCMKTRATNPNIKSAKNYLLRGIGICEEWKKFENFYRDMGDAPDGLSIDRIDNDDGYYRENCRWATAKQQANNKRKKSHKLGFYSFL